MKLLILTCLTLCLVACEGQLTCPTYWTRNGDSCYRIFGLAQPYMRASEVCQLFTSCGSSGTRTGQGHLASVNTYEENQFLFSFLAGGSGEIPPPAAWIGLTDFDPVNGQGDFRWADGTLPGSQTFSAWANNFPRQNGNTNCAVYGEFIQPRWIDINCEEELQYICEVPASISACAGVNMQPPANNPVPSPILTNPNKPKTIRYKLNKYSGPV